MSSLEKSQIDSVFDICLPDQRRCLRELKGINKLEILTLGELLELYEKTNGIPANSEEVHELATLISGKDITVQSIDYAKKILGERDVG